MAISLMASPASAHTDGDEYSYTIDVDQYIFVMLSRKSLEDELLLRGPADTDRIRDLRGRYPRSGLYSRDGKSADPLWTVDWYSHGVHVATDGIHLVRT